MKHTPWKANSSIVIDSNGDIVALLHDGCTDFDNATANAKRIVECVNACEGMEDPAKEIEALKAKYKELEQKYNDTAAGDAFYQTEMKILDQENDKLRAENERLKQKATP